MRRRLPDGQRGLAAYGGFSLAAGLGLLAVMVAVYWATTADLMVAALAAYLLAAWTTGPEPI